MNISILECALISEILLKLAKENTDKHINTHGLEIYLPFFLLEKRLTIM